MLSDINVKKIAKLANLNLTESEVGLFVPQLSKVIDYVAKLSTVDTKNVTATFNVTGLVNVWRDDVVTDSLSQEDALKNAKRTERGYFVVDRVAAGEA
ncbi:MAG: Asp-tRNA(Asn)/Glu-tRNA(Gln) amidotransferase subunit GatC [candidate division WWE3 bacterium]|nr:Asp-tRNA(Asn)/Glu-tRNA(Gln) amidotransferase subunit GatC [candidate division WWE3 bacterium]